MAIMAGARLERGAGAGGSQSVESVALSQQIVVADLDSDQLLADDVAGLPVGVHAALAEIGTGQRGMTPGGVSLASRDEIFARITLEVLIRFEDRGPYKMVTRHLARRSLTPAAYRATWGLPFDHPMAAPRLSARPTAVAKSGGWGRLRRAVSEHPPAAHATQDIPEGAGHNPREPA